RVWPNGHRTARTAGSRRRRGSRTPPPASARSRPSTRRAWWHHRQVKRALLFLIVACAVAVVSLDGAVVHRSYAGPQTTVTWDGVAPLFASKCAGCHRIGGIAPFSLTTARSAHTFAPVILRMTQANEMPP